MQKIRWCWCNQVAASINANCNDMRLKCQQTPFLTPFEQHTWVQFLHSWPGAHKFSCFCIMNKKPTDSSCCRHMKDPHGDLIYVIDFILIHMNSSKYTSLTTKMEPLHYWLAESCSAELLKLKIEPGTNNLDSKHNMQVYFMTKMPLQSTTWVKYNKINWNWMDVQNINKKLNAKSIHALWFDRKSMYTTTKIHVNLFLRWKLQVAAMLTFIFCTVLDLRD